MRLKEAFRLPPHWAREKAVNRLSRLTEGAVLDYAVEAHDGVWKTLEAYGKHPDSHLLVEAEKGLQVLLGAVDVLRAKRR